MHRATRRRDSVASPIHIYPMEPSGDATEAKEWAHTELARGNGVFLLYAHADNSGDINEVKNRYAAYSVSRGKNDGTCVSSASSPTSEAQTLLAFIDRRKNGTLALEADVHISGVEKLAVSCADGEVLTLKFNPIKQVGSAVDNRFDEEDMFALLPSGSKFVPDCFMISIPSLPDTDWTQQFSAKQLTADFTSGLLPAENQHVFVIGWVVAFAAACIWAGWEAATGDSLIKDDHTNTGSAKGADKTSTYAWWIRWVVIVSSVVSVLYYVWGSYKVAQDGNSSMIDKNSMFVFTNAAELDLSKLGR